MTPAWPQMNSSYNVSFSSREVLLKLMKESHQELTTSLESGNINFLNFYHPFEFFKQHGQFLEITIVGKDEDQFLLWKGYIEAKLRYLTEELENLMNYYDFMIQVWPRTYGPDDIPIKKEYISKFNEFPLKEKIYIGLSLDKDYDVPIDLGMVVKEFLIRIEKGWSKENQKRDPGLLNLFIYILDQGDIKREKVQESIEKSPNLEPKNLSFKKHEKSLKLSSGKDQILKKRNNEEFKEEEKEIKDNKEETKQIPKKKRKPKVEKSNDFDIVDIFG
jgi:poly(A) polymerase Pap1